MNRDLLAENVRLLLGVRGLTQAELARSMGASRERVTQIMNIPTEASVGRIAGALGVPVEWLSDPALAGKTVTELRGEIMTKQQRMYQRIQEYGEILVAFFSLPPDTDPVKLCKGLHRIETTAHRLAEACCNGEIEDSVYAEKEQALILRLIKIIPSAGSTCFINGDPRGYALKITEEASKTFCGHKDWGGYGILAPDFSEGKV